MNRLCLGQNSIGFAQFCGQGPCPVGLTQQCVPRTYGPLRTCRSCRSCQSLRSGVDSTGNSTVSMMFLTVGPPAKTSQVFSTRCCLKCVSYFASGGGNLGLCRYRLILRENWTHGSVKMSVTTANSWTDPHCIALGVLPVVFHPNRVSTQKPPRKPLAG